MIRRSSLTWPIILGVALLVLILSLLVLWIVAQVATRQWALMTVGTVFFTLALLGVVSYLVLTIKEVRLNRRQANFIDSVTHELKSPIASIKLCLQTLDLREVPPLQQREFHKYMLEDVQRLDALIDHLLTVARLGDTEPPDRLEQTALTPLLMRCAEEIRRRYMLDEKQVQLDLKDCLARAGSRDLEMVFLNLLDNAAKYAAQTPEIHIQVYPQGKRRIIVRISDNGRGVKYEFRRKIFQRFVRGGSELERTTQGTGLGLYIVKSLVSKMRGKIHVHARGFLRGATFEVNLPGTLAPVAPSAATELESPAKLA